MIANPGESMVATIKVSVVSGPHAGKEFVFDKPSEFTFGRSPQADCCLEGDPLVSRLHACLVADPATPSLGIRDLGSTNGFRINNTPTAGKASPRDDVIPLANGDEVMIGKSRMRVTIELPDATDDSAETVDSDDAEEGGAMATAEPAAAFRMGRRRADFIDIPGYTVLQQLGSGGMGAVYKAKKNDADAIVAIKIMTNSVVVDQKMLDMFQREIEVTKNLRHPNIIRFWDSGCLDSVFYLVIEYVGGGDMGDLIKKSQPFGLEMGQALELIKQTTDAMSYAHRKFLVHRDLKPSNILLDDSGPALVAKVADLGLAKNFNNSGLSGMTASFTRGGTMAYMPPEQLSEFRDVKPTADVFSLAATFYEMLTGKIVYDFKEGVSPFITISECRIRPLRDVNPDVPENVALVLERALARNPEDRYQDAGFFLAGMYDHAFFG